MASCATESSSSSLLEKIESFLNDSQYRETVESSVNYNTRLCIERRLRMPFLDSQTGVAQNHSNLFMTSRHRLPGFLQGQIYTYPSKRWRKKRRQYLSHFLQPRRGTVMPAKEAGDEAGEHFHTISTVENPAAVSVNDEASKDSIKEDPKEWYINEDDIYDMDGFDEPDPDSDYDYEESYRKKKKRNSKPARGSTTDSPHNKKAKPVGRGRKKTPTVYPDPSDPEKPFGCDKGSPKKAKGAPGIKSTPSSAGHSRPTTPAGEETDPNVERKMGNELGGLAPEDRRPKANPSPYCDFCLGDASENKKSGAPEVLVSCADCGRSGHPSCLQFTANMIISYRKYRWQCIECKCCSICGNSDNDDQLLFCDDCDRGYHMYCLSPPLTSPPEGSWSCRLCLAEFHNK
ncbi:zinc finger protein ubi-d4 B isoform X3 [Frankliniella occidentalis]|uniref:Zinc finger protein ubi-d4 B isoform X3 n=1 Tax=Frankliniella occidentalis TaxID=133901 RepID=A0A6J1S008_FRAOC|nr:zinc finger protein ubi-d4 B isoform X3 [Frankliniella occidentalis]